MKSFTIAASAVLAVTSVAAQATTGVEQPAQTPALNNPTVQGCFSAAGDLVFNSVIQWNAIGPCCEACKAMNPPRDVAATMGGNQCFCGDAYPPASALADDSKCNVGCSGYDLTACGGINFYTVYNTGRNLSVTNLPDDTSSSSSTTSSAGHSATSPAAAVTLTTTASPSSQPSSGGSNNTAGIAAGVVVGVAVVASVVGGVFFMLRRRRNMEIESEHRRNAAVNSFVGGAKPPSSSGGFSIGDQRLDPVMAQRRMSSGSIADNQDYSRRILRVTNA